MITGNSSSIVEAYLERRPWVIMLGDSTAAWPSHSTAPVGRIHVAGHEPTFDTSQSSTKMGRGAQWAWAERNVHRPRRRKRFDAVAASRGVVQPY